MKKRWLSLLLLLALVVSVLPMNAQAVVYDGVVEMYVETANGGTVNLRSGPGTDHKVYVKVPYGAKVTVTERPYGSTWYSCTYNGYYGYISSRYLSYTKPQPFPKPTATPKPVVADKTIFNKLKPSLYEALVIPSTPTSFVHLRWAPTKQAPVIADYYSYQVLYVIAESNEWCQVIDPVSNLSGFMMKSFLKYNGPFSGFIVPGGVGIDNSGS